MPHRPASRPARSLATAAALTALCVVAGGVGPATLGSAAAADDPGARYAKKTPTSTGFGGAVSSVDPEASKIGLKVLKSGGNAVDAAVATAAALGVTEPYSAGIGGGGYFVYYDARTRKVRTIDGRETAPMSMPKDAFIDPDTEKPYPFTPDLVTSGVSVGVPGTLATWERALQRWGTDDLRTALEPAERLAARGFKVDQTFHDQTEDNQERFEAYKTTPKLFLPGGKPPAGGLGVQEPRPRRDLPDDRAQGHRRLLPRQAGQGDRQGGAQAGHQQQDRAAGAAWLHEALGPQALRGAGPAAHQEPLPRSPGLRDGAVLVGWYDGRRGAQHHGALRPGRDVARAGAAPLPRSHGAGVRRPGEVPRRPGQGRRTGQEAARRHLRRRAGLPDRPDAGDDQAGRAGDGEVLRRRLHDHQSHRRRQRR